MRRKRTALPTLILLIGLVTVPVILTWREVRQEQLNNSLIAAIDRNDAAGMRSLVRQGADVNRTSNSNRRTPLMAAASRPDDCKINLVIMRLLLAHGAKVNATGENGWSALTWAATSGSADGVKLLLNHGANARIRDVQNASRIRIARDSDHRNPMVIRLLRAAGAKD